MPMSYFVLTLFLKKAKTRNKGYLWHKRQNNQMKYPFIQKNQFKKKNCLINLPDAKNADSEYGLIVCPLRIHGNTPAYWTHYTM